MGRVVVKGLYEMYHPKKFRKFRNLTILLFYFSISILVPIHYIIMGRYTNKYNNIITIYNIVSRRPRGRLGWKRVGVVVVADDTPILHEHTVPHPLFDAAKTIAIGLRRAAAVRTMSASDTARRYGTVRRHIIIVVVSRRGMYSGNGTRTAKNNTLTKRGEYFRVLLLRARTTHPPTYRRPTVVL